jgi:pyruvate dehydrogenase E1 component beta subunit
LLKSAIRDDGPVLVSEDRLLYQHRGRVPADDYTIPLGEADVKRVGKHVTIVALSMMVPLALRAAEELAKEGIEVEVVDPRTLVPLDVETLVSSVRRTSRALVLDQACVSFGASAEIAAVISQEAFDFLDAPVMRVGALDVPVPYSQALEPSTIPNQERVVAAVRDLVAAGT